MNHSAHAAGQPRAPLFGPEIAGHLFVLTAAVLWGFLGPVSTWVAGTGMTALAAAFWRALLGAAVFGLHALATGKLAVRPADAPKLVLFGLVSVSGFYGAYFSAIRYGGSGLASILLYTAPAWVACLSRIFLAEPLTRLKLLAVGLTVAGTSLAGLGGPQRADSGDLTLAVACGLIAGLTYALYYVAGKKLLSSYSTETIFAWILPVGALGLAPFADLGDAPRLLPAAWPGLAGLAVCCTYLAFRAYYAGLKRLEASRAAITASFEPVVAGVVAWGWQGEVMTLPAILGGGLILAAALMMIFDRPKPVAG